METVKLFQVYLLRKYTKYYECNYAIYISIYFKIFFNTYIYKWIEMAGVYKIFKVKYI